MLRSGPASSLTTTPSTMIITLIILLVVIVSVASKSGEGDIRFHDDVGNHEHRIALKSPDDGNGVMAVPDEATTYTGRPIHVDVLSNDYHVDGTTSLVLSGISSNGDHGECSIVGDIVTATISSILYEPHDGYSGYDECAYEVCAFDDIGTCDVAYLTITIAKQLDGGDGPLEFDLDSCSPGDEMLLTMELQTDKHGSDVSWEIRKVITTTTLQRIKRGGGYAHYSYDRIDVCVQTSALYTFVIFDEFGDGLCDHGEAGVCGYYKIYLDGREIINVSYYGTRNNHLINVGFDPTPGMTDRETEYLLAHNERRRIWHEMHNVSYVPLSWSPMLAEESARWAEELLAACDSDGIEHESGVLVGENLAKNKGYEVEDGVPNIVRRWVDREVGWLYPHNAHLTQSLWRASKYLGCGESEKNYNGGKCRVQVCRYAKAGNCDMTRYNSTEGENWLIPMLKDSSPCEPSCPPEGCF
ncbi:hypothetical protein ACHAXA_011520 [Cyclostephanos tholiformis]|uniref:SCP domain-containing protein n=1 Tax=Cyclostephanos tholiformis TaxID=382380 RepID=A0ABD3RR32_9STRA